METRILGKVLRKYLIRGRSRSYFTDRLAALCHGGHKSGLIYPEPLMSDYNSTLRHHPIA